LLNIGLTYLKKEKIKEKSNKDRKIFMTSLNNVTNFMRISAYRYFFKSIKLMGFFHPLSFLPYK
jgi:hypothetical protein